MLAECARREVRVRAGPQRQCRDGGDGSGGDAEGGVEAMKQQHMTPEQFRNAANGINAVIGGLDTGIAREALAFAVAECVSSVYRQAGFLAALKGIIRFIRSSVGYYRYVMKK